MKTKRIRNLSDDALAWTVSDLMNVIQIQEFAARAGHRCPKLGHYWDDLHACIAERRRREQKQRKQVA